MRKWKTLILTATLTVGIGCLTGAKAQASSVKIDQANFPDASVRTYVTQYDTNKDDVLSDEERDKVTKFAWYWHGNKDRGVDNKRKVDFTGIQYFTKIKNVKIDLLYELYEEPRTELSAWQYKDSDLTKYFPNMEKLEIYAKKGQEVKLSGESASLKNIQVTWERDEGTLDCTMKASKVKEVYIDGGYINSNVRLGECFPNAETVDAYYSDLGKGKTLSGFRGLKHILLGGKKLTSINLQPLKSSEKTLKSIEIKNGSVKKLDLSPLKKMHLSYLGIENVTISKLDLRPLKQTGISMLKLQGCPVKKLDLSPLKGSLKSLILGDDQYQYYYYYGQYSNDEQRKQNKKQNTFHMLDLSQMKKLREVYAGGAWNIQSVKLLDAKKKTGARSLRELHLYGTNIKSLDVAGTPNLRRLFVGDSVKKLDISKSKKLYELGVINKGTTKLSLKSKSLKHLVYTGKKGRKLDLSQCPKLCSLTIRGLAVSSLDLSKNHRLTYVNTEDTKVKTLKMPCITGKKKAYRYELVEKADVIPDLGEIEGTDGVYASYNGYDFVGNGKIRTLDLSAYKKLRAYVKKQQLADGFRYNRYSVGNCKVTRIVINKNLRKSDKKWVKKMAKKQKIKVIEK